MKSLTIVYLTGRGDAANYYWFVYSLARQLRGRTVEVIRVDFDGPEFDGSQKMCVAPKPSIWQGKYKQTSEEWWAASNGRNTGIALCETEWIAFCDDRSYLAPSWLDSVEAAMEGNYVVCGSYEKRKDMVIYNGEVLNCGTLMSMDNRWEHAEKEQLPIPYRCAGNWVYGCSLALPMEWALQVGGFEEALDGASGEDTAFGIMLANNGYPIYFDQRMHLVEDRTPTTPMRSFRREDYGTEPADKSHKALELFGSAKQTSNRHMLLQSRAAVLAGKPFPMNMGSQFDWWNGAPINKDYPHGQTHS